MRRGTAETGEAAWPELAWKNYFSHLKFYIPKSKIKIKEKLLLSNFEYNKILAILVILLQKGPKTFALSSLPPPPAGLATSSPDVTSALAPSSPSRSPSFAAIANCYLLPPAFASGLWRNPAQAQPRASATPRKRNPAQAQPRASATPADVACCCACAVDRCNQGWELGMGSSQISKFMKLSRAKPIAHWFRPSSAPSKIAPFLYIIYLFY